MTAPPDPATELKELIKKSRLGQPETANLLGVTYDALRSYLRPASSPAARTIPAGTVEYMRFLVEHSVVMASETARTISPAEMAAALGDGTVKTLSPAEISAIERRLKDAEYRDITVTVETARRLLASASMGSLMRVLSRIDTDGEPICYGLRNGGAMVALLTPSSPFLKVEIVQEILVPGQSIIEPVPYVFEFVPPYHDIDGPTADDVAKCVLVDGAPPPKGAIQYLTVVYAVIISHGLVQAGVML